MTRQDQTEIKCEMWLGYRQKWWEMHLKRSEGNQCAVPGVVCEHTSQICRCPLLEVKARLYSWHIVTLREYAYVKSVTKQLFKTQGSSPQPSITVCLFIKLRESVTYNMHLLRFLVIPYCNYNYRLHWEENMRFSRTYICLFSIILYSEIILSL